jgi:wyosine [tRNA(Phe)-imidazoG37] synthetase (radical SAM superfamily)
MKYIFGPVNSRRLGRSLGIDLFAYKICNLNCIYCEVGTASTSVGQRAYYTSPQAIIEEIDVFCADPGRLDTVDVFTVTAKGEPTLHSGLGQIIRHLKRVTDKPVAVLTNGTTLMHSDVRQELAVADIVIPSLDAALAESFLKVDRPGADVDLEKVIEGLTFFSHTFRGKLWLEILLVQDFNDSSRDIEALISAARCMRLDRIQLNTVVRPPAEHFARPLERERLVELADYLHENLGVPVDLPFAPAEEAPRMQPPAILETNRALSLDEVLEEILQMLKRRPCTAVDIDRTFQLGGPDKVEQLLEPFVNSGVLQRQNHENTCYYQ